MVDGVPGGRSTHGICFGALAWLVEDGRVGEVDVSGLAAVLVVRYDDDEPGSPWTIVLHVDAAGNDRQRAALADVFLGRLGGPRVGVLPWVRKARHLLGCAQTRSSSCRTATVTSCVSATPCAHVPLVLLLSTRTCVAAFQDTTSPAGSLWRTSWSCTTIRSAGS